MTTFCFLPKPPRAATALVALGIVVLAGCAKKEPAPVVTVAEEEASQELPIEEGTKSEGGLRLRDRMKVTSGEAKSKPSWSTAVTVEERRANLDKALATGQEPYLIDLHDLGGWEMDLEKEQPIPDYILALDGKEFIVRGFMLPDIDLEKIREFHFVRSLYSCCFGAPPQMNEIMRVRLADEDGMEYSYKTLEIRGRLHVKFEKVDGLVEDIFRMEDATYRAFSYFDDPDAPESFDADTDLEGFVPKGGG